jgi:hypothetical protein
MEPIMFSRWRINFKVNNIMNRKLNITLLLFVAVFVSFKAKAQIENVIVETYYASDTLDATDTIGGILEAGSKTYRIYVDLAPGSKLKEIFGCQGHTLRFSSTALFWNNLDRGESFGYDFNKNYLDEGTVALDTYITLGQTTKNSTTTYFGILKSQDPDTSIIGGVNNDGGWSAIPDGLISNQDSAAGIPVTLKDGLVAVANPPTGQAQNGILVPITLQDSTIFGSLKPDSQFVSNYASVQCSGAEDVTSGNNQVLIAQLTTKGEISFELNLKVEDAGGNLIIYVASDSVAPTNDTIISPFLKYPASCGCANPDYVEYSNLYACNDSSQCKTLIVYCCMDPKACNYDPNANFNITTLCCYPGYCNDRNLAVVCPSLNNERMRVEGSRLYPDPAQDELTLEIPAGVEAAIQLGIYDAYGNNVAYKDLGVGSDHEFEKLDITGLSQGLYIVRINIGNGIYTKKFVKI